MTPMYPSWRYHATKEARIVPDEAASAALGPDWADTPAAFPEPEPDADELATLTEDPARGNTHQAPKPPGKPRR